MKRGYESTNEFHYLQLINEKYRKENEDLKQNNKELLQILEESRHLIERLSK